jgi:hypothetical protein
VHPRATGATSHPKDTLSRMERHHYGSSRISILLIIIRLMHPMPKKDIDADWRFRDPFSAPSPYGDDEELEPLDWRRTDRRREPSLLPPPSALLRALSQAEDTLSRLDASAMAAPEAVREGLATRIAFREASGWLSHAQAWVHPLDLCLRDLGLTGSFLAAAAGGRIQREMPVTTLAMDGMAVDLDAPDSLPEDQSVATALALARILKRLATHVSWRPMGSASSMHAAMSAVGGAVDPQAFDGWKATWKREADAKGPLLAALDAARSWPSVEEAQGASEWLPERHLRPLLAAAIVVRTSNRLQAVPLPFWSVVTLGRPAAALGPGSSDERSTVAALGQLVEGARAGLRELARLHDAARVACDLTRGLDPRSRLPAAVDAALRVPALTPNALAKQINVTQQTANDLLRQLERRRVIREVTGRRAFRAYTV